jgi:hypothetical protein
LPFFSTASHVAFHWLEKIPIKEFEDLFARVHRTVGIAICIALIGLGTVSADAADGPYLGRALAGTIGSNLLIWGWDRYVLGASWAEINPDTWRGNIEEGLVWDNSVFVTNQILHPYQGSLYFNSARSIGFSFWQAVPFTVGGSLMWEFFMESHHPSLNDLITTSFGGVAFGEMNHRLSSLLLDDPTTSSVGPGRQITAAIFNPVGTLTGPHRW